LSFAEVHLQPTEHLVRSWHRLCRLPDAPELPPSVVTMTSVGTWNGEPTPSVMPHSLASSMATSVMVAKLPAPRMSSWPLPPRRIYICRPPKRGRRHSAESRAPSWGRAVLLRAAEASLSCTSAKKALTHFSVRSPRALTGLALGTTSKLRSDRTNAHDNTREHA
jgi:hypothetical protein